MREIDHDQHVIYDPRCKLCIIEYRETWAELRKERPDLFEWYQAWDRTPKRNKEPKV